MGIAEGSATAVGALTQHTGTASEHSPTVCAVLGGYDRELQSASAAQERPAEIIAGISKASLANTDWIWLLDGTALPAPGALAALLAAAHRLDPVASPILLASVIVGSDGRLAPAHVPLAPQDKTAVAVRTAPLRVVPVRAVTGASLLIRSDRFIGSPRPGIALMVAWTARCLREGGGFLVPSSVARARPVTNPRFEQAALAARLLLGTVLHPKERLRVAAEICERARHCSTASL